MATILHPMPYPTRNKNFRAAGTISPGDLVVVDSSGYVTRTTESSDDEWIGQASYNASQFQANDRDYYSSGDQCEVHLRGDVRKTPLSVTTALITPGNFVKLGSPGKVAVEATAATKTLNTVGMVIVGGSSTCEWIEL